MFICLGVDISMIIGMSWAMIVILKDVIEEDQSCLSNAPLHIKQDNDSIDK